MKKESMGREACRGGVAESRLEEGVGGECRLGRQVGKI